MAGRYKSQGKKPFLMQKRYKAGDEQKYDHIKVSEAQKKFADSVRNKAERGVVASINVPLSKNEFDALCSLVFNIGSFLSAPKLKKLINNGDYINGSKEMLDINKANNVVEEGIKIRWERSMIYLFRVFIILIINYLLPNVAYSQQIVGGWDLVKILSVNGDNNAGQILREGMRLELMSLTLTIWPEPTRGTNRGNLDLYCHPERMDGLDLSKGDYSKDERLKQFLKKVGGLNGLDKILRKNFKFSLKKFEFAYVTGPNEDGKEPCKSIENVNFYVTKDRKSVYMFIYPYIYQFKGGFGYVGGGAFNFGK
jgi:hypothetical protein